MPSEKNILLLLSRECHRDEAAAVGGRLSVVSKTYTKYLELESLEIRQRQSLQRVITDRQIPGVPNC